MNRRADLPGPDAPSAEVLDELLRAFAADTTDAATLQRIDLTSPEVDELISGSPTGTPRPGAEPAYDTAGEPVQPEPAEEPAEPAVAADESRTADDAPPVDDSSTGAGPSPADGPKRIVVIDDESGVIDGEPSAPVEAVRTVPAGDPLLAAAANAETAPLVTQVLEDGRIFIDDSAAPDAITMEEAVTATRIEPRLRERRSAVKKAKTRKRLKWFLIVFFLIALIVGGLAVLGSGLFAIEDVTVEGADQADPEAVDAVVEELLGTPVLRADTDAAEAALEAIPQVQDARVTTDFPHGARIEVRERTAMATYEGTDGSYRVIDSQGRVLEVVDEPPEELLPVTADAAPDLPPASSRRLGTAPPPA